MRSPQPRVTGSALRVFRRAGVLAARLVCCPHAGGGASFFRRWADALPPSVEVVSVQYPGREDRLTEPFAQTLSALADEVAVGLRRMCGPPVVLFGHSLGAAVAYEVALRLEADGTPPAMLVVSGREAPRAEGRGVHLLSDDEVWADLAAAGGTRQELIRSPEVRAMLLPILRADCELSAAYRPATGALVTCPILACVGDRDPDVPRLPDWADRTTGGFELRTFEGHHFYLIEAWQALTALILSRLSSVAGIGTLWPTAP